MAIGQRQRRRDSGTTLQVENDRSVQKIMTRLLLMERPATPWLIGITSAIRGEGKTTLAYQLAATLAGSLAERLVLVELDLSTPVLATRLGLSAAPGLADVVLRGLPLTAAGRATPVPNLTVVPAGQGDGALARLAHAPEMDQLWPMLGHLGSVVICDLPAVLANAETPFLARHMDTLVLTVRAGATPAPLVRQAIDQLDQQRIAGVVLNGTQHRLPGWLRHLLGEWDE
jgi:Mrp family chromosome partitioning ATPase